MATENIYLTIDFFANTVSELLRISISSSQTHKPFSTNAKTNLGESELYLPQSGCSTYILYPSH